VERQKNKKNKVERQKGKHIMEKEKKEVGVQTSAGTEE